MTDISKKNNQHRTVPGLTVSALNTFIAIATLRHRLLPGMNSKFSLWLIKRE